MGEDDALQREHDSGLGRGLIGTPEVDLGLALDGEDHLAVVIDEVGPDRMGPPLLGTPFHNEYDRHVVLRRRKAGGTELVEDAGDIELAVVTDHGGVASERENEFHGARKMNDGNDKSNGCLLVALSHPDDEIAAVGTIAAHRAMGIRVVMLFLTRGEMTESLGPLSPAEVAAERTRHATQVAALLGAEVQFLDFTDTRIGLNAAAIHRVAPVIAGIKPNAVITWGSAWMRGMRHPDHQATGEIIRGALTVARMKRAVAPVEPHRGEAPVFALRDRHSQLPCAAIDVSAHIERVITVARFYKERVGWPDEEWMRERLRTAGQRWGVAAAEEFDAWESVPGLRLSLLGDQLPV